MTVFEEEVSEFRQQRRKWKSDFIKTIERVDATMENALRQVAAFDHETKQNTLVSKKLTDLLMVECIMRR